MRVANQRVAMQVDDTEAVSGTKGGSGLSISLHPLVIINISDHSTRFRALNAGKAKRVIGVLLGKLVSPVSIWANILHSRARMTCC